MASSAEISSWTNSSARSDASDGLDAPAKEAHLGSAYEGGSWLEWFRSMLPSVEWCVLLSGNPLRQQSIWPSQQQQLPGLIELANQAIARAETCQCILPGALKTEVLAIPLRMAAKHKAVLLLECKALDARQRQSAVQLAHWATYWLDQPASPSTQAHPSNKFAADDLSKAIVSSVQQSGSVEAASMCVVNLLATKLQCKRVSLAVVGDSGAKLQAVSGLSKLDLRRHATLQIVDAMSEINDAELGTYYRQGGVAHAAAPTTSLVAHAALAQAGDSRAVYGLKQDKTNGSNGIVLLIERDDDQSTALELSELRQQLMPVLALIGVLHRSNRSLPKLRDGVTGLIQSVREKHYWDKHLVLSVCGLLAITALLLPVPHRVTVRVAIEASDRQVLVAPQAGYILSAHARAGDQVKKGSVLAKLDQRELQLNADKWHGEKLKNEQEYAQALAKHDRVSLSQLRADALRIDAELALAQQQLQRSELRAPFDGVLLDGDLSQSFGSPVEEGAVLFEIGSIDQYRLQIDVDEHDIGFVEQGQSVKIRMTALPGQTFEAKLEAVMPVAVAKQGSSIFRIPGEFVGDASQLRPGMAGVGKVATGSRSLLWIVTHALTDRLSIWFWKLGLIR